MSVRSICSIMRSLVDGWQRCRNWWCFVVLLIYCQHSPLLSQTGSPLLTSMRANRLQAPIISGASLSSTSKSLIENHLKHQISSHQKLQIKKASKEAPLLSQCRSAPATAPYPWLQWLTSQKPQIRHQKRILQLGTGPRFDLNLSNDSLRSSSRFFKRRWL